MQSLERGDRLFELNPRSLLVPASSLKLVTAALAGAAVGWDYTFETTAAITGPVENGGLQGDLIITGTGDPTLLGRAGGDYATSLLSALKGHGVTTIAGRVIGNDDLVDEPRPGYSWSWDDLGFPFGAVSGGLNIAENVIQVTVSPGASQGEPAVITLPPEAGNLFVENRTETAAAKSERTLWPEHRPGKAGLTLFGTIAIDAKPTVLMVAALNPTLSFARFIRARLLAAGIQVHGAAADADDLKERLPPGTVIHVERSRPLSDIVKAMQKDSINLYADALLRLATGPAGTRSTPAALIAAKQQLEAWDIAADAAQIEDGSGLSRRNVIAPEALLAILQRHYDPAGTSPFVQALPIAGVDGTLGDRMKGTAAEGNAKAKTGTMTNIRALAGYVRTQDGEPLAFVIIVNNFEGKPTDVIASIDRLVVRLASFSRTRPSAN